ncbi:MAG: hypothetical protein ACE5R6_12510 [Candidatus Heimdallarchaeota archaeon]
MTLHQDTRVPLIKILAFIAISALISGISYYIRENYLFFTGLQSSTFRVIRMTVVYILFPFWWAMTKLGTRMGEFGLTTKNLKESLLYGSLVYAIALGIFIYNLNNSTFYSAFAGGYEQMTLAELILTGTLFSWMAAVTDIWTRGFILLQVTKYSNATFGVLMQNCTWVLVHLYEIAILAPVLSLPGAITLTLVLGTTGDVAALKTHNIVGLAFGHVMLNIGFMAYVIL